MQVAPEVFWNLTSTAWTAVGSIVGAASIIGLVVFNILTLKAAFRGTRAAEAQARVAQDSLSLLQDQQSLTQRPFVAIRSKYCEEIEARLVYAHNQGNGPALDVKATLTYDDGSMSKSNYLIGCLAVDADFQFLIGEESNKLIAATIWYKSLSDAPWTTQIALIGGSPASTAVVEGYEDEDKERSRVKALIFKATQTEA